MIRKKERVVVWEIVKIIGVEEKARGESVFGGWKGEAVV